MLRLEELHQSGQIHPGRRPNKHANVRPKDGEGDDLGVLPGSRSAEERIQEGRVVASIIGRSRVVHARWK